MKIISLCIALHFALLNLSSAQTNNFESIKFWNETGDKIALERNQLNLPTMNGFGLESNALYFKSRDRYRWYVYSNADAGVSDVMELSPNGLSVNALGVGLNTSTPSAYYGEDYIQPQSMLHINAFSEGQAFRIYQNGNNTDYLNMYQGTNKAVIDPVGSGKLLLGESENTDVLINGNLAIGTTELNGYQMAVKGTMSCENLKVIEVSGWADFVFSPDYALKSIYEVEAFIQENKHLPNVPSEKEIKERGFKISEMQAVLLQKIEELTLYSIDLKKQIEALR